jgi:hypothetical protein
MDARPVSYDQLFHMVWPNNIIVIRTKGHTVPDDQLCAECILHDHLADHPEGVLATALATRQAVLVAASESSELIGQNYAVIDVFTLTGQLG